MFFIGFGTYSSGRVEKFWELPGVFQPGSSGKEPELSISLNTTHFILILASKLHRTFAVFALILNV